MPGLHGEAEVRGRHEAKGAKDPSHALLILTPKHQAFVTAYLKDLNATAAYISVYGKMAESVAASASSRLLKNVKVATAIAKAQAKATEKAGMTLQGHLDTLESLRDAARGAGQYGAAITAESLRGKVSGYYVEKVEHSGGVDLSSTEREAAIVGILTNARKRQKEMVS
jgi:hypothetical protein